MKFQQCFIKSSQDYQQVFKQNLVINTRFFKIWYRKGLPGNKMGVIASKKVGKANVRNLVKRRIRHFFYENQSLFLENCWFIVVAKSYMTDLTFAQFSSRFLSCLRYHKLLSRLGN